MKEIGPRAFSGCQALADENGFVIIKDVLYKYVGKGGEVNIPEGVKRIENSAFSNCDAVTGVTFPSSIREIGNNAFYSCSGLTSVTIPEGVREIGIKAFDWCLYLKDIRLPQSVKTIKTDAINSLVMIHAPAGSYAEQYAKKNGNPFVAE